MTPQIKQRIEQIRRGEVPEGYKKTKVGVVPNEWEETRFKKMFSRLSRKNKENNDNVLTISAQYGLISQRDFFNKDIASEDKSNYFLLHNGEFAYNKSYSNGYPFGALKRLDMCDKGIVSPLYICFSANENNECPDFYVHYFEAGMMNREIQAFAQEGARNHGLLNISVDDFFNSYLLMPPRPEQEKIAEILSAQDKLIALKEKLIEEKKRQKKALMQQLLSGKKRLSGFNEIWETCCITDVCNFTGGAQPPKSEWINYPADGYIRMLQTRDFTQQNGTFQIEYVKIKNSTKQCCEDDIMIARYGASIGKILTGKAGAYNVALMKASPDESRIKRSYLKYVLQNNDFQEFIKSVCSRAAQAGFNKEDLNEYMFFLPSLEEQEMIKSVIAAFELEIELLQKDLDQEKQKKKALMQLLLTGIVRVQGNE